MKIVCLKWFSNYSRCTADAKFPHQSNSGQPPSPSRENPGAVYPKSSPTAAKPQEIPGSGGATSEPRSVFSNPFEFQDELSQLGAALDRVIAAIDSEGKISVGQGQTGNTIDGNIQPHTAKSHLQLRNKFQQWKTEVAEMVHSGRAERSAGDGIGTAPDVGSTNCGEGGLFND